MLWVLLSEQGSECGLIQSSEQPSSPLLHMGKPSAQRLNILAEGPRLGRGEAKRERAQSSSPAYTPWPQGSCLLWPASQAGQPLRETLVSLSCQWVTRQLPRRQGNSEQFLTVQVERWAHKAKHLACCQMGPS